MGMYHSHALTWKWTSQIQEPFVFVVFQGTRKFHRVFAQLVCFLSSSDFGPGRVQVEPSPETGSLDFGGASICKHMQVETSCQGKQSGQVERWGWNMASTCLIWLPMIPLPLTSSCQCLLSVHFRFGVSHVESQTLSNTKHKYKHAHWGTAQGLRWTCSWFVALSENQALFSVRGVVGGVSLC